MNVIEIEEAVSELFGQPFERDTFPFAFLEAYGNKRATIDKLKKGNSNKSDFDYGVLQKNNIHIVTCERGHIPEKLKKLRETPANQKFKVKFIFVTDGVEIHAEDLNSGDLLICQYKDLPNNFSFFLSLFGFSSLANVKESSFDIRATSRFNRLYVQLLKDNPQWRALDRRADMNHFMAGLIFCFFAEDTRIFSEDNLFTETVNKMSDSSSSNTHEIISEIFRAMNTPHQERSVAGVRRWADKFPYVNGGVFSGSSDSPVFSRIARSYLISIGSLDWQQINPDIFGSMIQAVADDEERQNLGLHYTSVPSILKVLNPLFLDELRERLEKAGDSSIKLLNLRKRLAKIRVFDPACGSGNFLVIAYKELRAIEAEINSRRKEINNRSVIPLTNFRGIEIKEFSAEIARLSLIIAEFQCNTLYLGQQDALTEILPLDSHNWITCGNALRLDWEGICPPTGEDVSLRGTDLFNTPVNQSEIDFENEGGETYVCGNPPYLGSTDQKPHQKSDLQSVCNGRISRWRSLDYVSAWFIKAVEFGNQFNTHIAFVATNSICQGEHVPVLWPLILKSGFEITFAHTNFKWSNLASHNAGVTVIIVGLSKNPTSSRKLYSIVDSGEVLLNRVEKINAYLAPGETVIVESSNSPLSGQSFMVKGNYASDGGHLSLGRSELDSLKLTSNQYKQFIRRYCGSAEFIRGLSRFCIWVNDEDVEEASAIESLRERFDQVKAMRLDSRAPSTQQSAKWSYKFIQIQDIASDRSIIIPGVSSELREYLPVGIAEGDTIINAQAFAIYDAPLWNMALIASRVHIIWVATVCGKLETRYRYSSTLGWNTFPFPNLTEKKQNGSNTLR